MSANVNGNVTLFRWKLVDMWKQRKDAGKNGLTSNIFSLRNRPSVQFELFVVNANFMKSQDDVRVVLKQLDDKPLEASVKIWIESTTGQKFNKTFVEKHTFGKVDDFCGYKKFSYNYKAFSTLYNNHETFYVCCKLTDLDAVINTGRASVKQFSSGHLGIPTLPAINTNKISSINRFSSVHSSISGNFNASSSAHNFDYEKEFVQHFWPLYEEQAFYDAIVKVDGKMFKISKFLFAAHSKVFKSMFMSKFKEGIKNEIEVKDMDEETMEHLVKWMYTSKLEENSPIENLFTVADKYDIALLKKICAQRMLLTLNGENAFLRLIIASLHNDTQLKEASLDCIAHLKSSQLVNFLTSQEWHEFYNKAPTVAREIGKMVRNKLHK